MNRAIKRITKDISDIYKNPLTENKIYIHYNEENIFSMQCLIIGTENTPYESGFYLFDFTFSEEYPMKPPKVEYCTLDGKTRFNPNLYTCGKVCLSIINTWQGEQWSPVNSITTVLLAIQSHVLVQEPLRNEPGFENCKDKRIEDYDNMIYYENFRVAIIKMLKQNDKRFEVFKPIMINYFMENYEKISNNVNILEEKIKDSHKKSANDEIILTAIYSMRKKVDFDNIKKDLDELYKYYIESQNFLCEEDN